MRRELLALLVIATLLFGACAAPAAPSTTEAPAESAWFYNKEIFADVGVEPPTTWTEFQDVGAKIQASPAAR